jgi:hypothetical protein
MRFLEAYEGWNQGRLSQEEAAEPPGMRARSFRRGLARYEAAGEAGLLDRRLEHHSARGASADKHRCHYVKAVVEAHCYPDGRMAVFHCPGS